MSERRMHIKVRTHQISLGEGGEWLRRGEVIHRALYFLEDCTSRGDVKQAVRKGLAAEGVVQGGWDIEEDLIDPIWSAVSLEGAKGWFAPGTQNLREVEVVDAEGGVHRIDRLVIREGRVEVIDFKIGRREGRHREQVFLYTGLVSEVFGLPARGYLLYIDEPAVVPIP